MKLVQIDNKTVIEVDGRISDERARREYLVKYNDKSRINGLAMEGNNHSRQGLGTKIKDIPRHDVVFDGDNTHRRKYKCNNVKSKVIKVDFNTPEIKQHLKRVSEKKRECMGRGDVDWELVDRIYITI